MELNVAVTVRIMPKGTDTDMEGVKKKIENVVKDFGRINTSEIKPIAFGLKALEITLLLDDKKGGMDKLEELIRRIPEVSEIETLGITRI